MDTPAPDPGGPTPHELRATERVLTALAWVVGLAGVVLGAIAFADDERTTAVALWVLSFAAGALLQAVGQLLRATAVLLRRTERQKRDDRT